MEQPTERCSAILLQTALRDEDIVRRHCAADLLEQEPDREALNPQLDEALHAGEAMVRRRAVLLVARLRIAPERAVAWLEEARLDPSWPVREAAVVALSGLEPVCNGRVHALLLESALRDGQALVRGAAADALGRAGGEEIVASLVEALSHPYFKVRRRAIEALARMQTYAARIVPVLRHLLDDSHRRIRQTAAESLGAFGKEAGSARERLARRTQDRERSVSTAAARALARIDGPKGEEMAP